MSSSEIEAARILLEKLGITPEQLLSSVTKRPQVPQIGEYISRLEQAVPPATLRVYGTYWDRVAHGWGQRDLTEPTPLEISLLLEETKQQAVIRRNSRGGRSAAEHMLGALRCMYRHAVLDGLIRESDNPAMRVPKPRRIASTRRAIPKKELAEIFNVAGTTGNDPDLDLILLRLHLETACRRGGALALTISDLDVHQCLLCLREKGETVRWQPISPTLAQGLVALKGERSLQEDPHLLCYRNGRPITRRRYDYIWGRIGIHVPWVATQQVSTHWLRHTTLTWVERNFSHGVARAYAGHSEKGGGGTTSTYVKADISEVATALSVLTGESHPLAIQSDYYDPVGFLPETNLTSHMHLSLS